MGGQVNEKLVMTSPLGQVHITVGVKKGEEEKSPGGRCIFKAGLKLFFIINQIITKGSLLKTRTHILHKIC